MKTFNLVNRLIVTGALIIACAAVSLANVADVRFTSGSSALNIPFKIVNNHIYLEVSINNSKPLWFLLDTGAGNIINQRHAQALGLKLVPAGQTMGVGEGVADVFFTDNLSYSLPGATVTRQKFAVLSFDGVEECLTKLDVDLQGRVTPRTQARDRAEVPIDGLLGSEFFRLFVVEIDYATKMINLHDPDKYRYQGGGEKIPIEVTSRHIYTRMSISSSPSALTGRFMIDSGSALSVLLNSPFVEQHKLLPPASQTTPFRVCGIGGDSQTQIGKVSEVQLGNIKLENPVTVFSQAQNGVLASTHFSGQIGNAFLRRFKVVFDYSRKVMILERANATTN